MEDDVVFPSTFVNSFTLVSKEGGSSFATFALHLVNVVLSVWCYVLLTPSPCLFVWKNCFSSATCEADVVTSMGVVWIFSRILRRIFPVALSASLCRKSAAASIKKAIVLFWSWIATLNHMQSTVLVKLLSFGRIAWLIRYLSEQWLTLLFLKKCVQTQEKPCILPRILPSWWTSSVAQ